MIIYRKGDIFNSNAQVITNPVNCVGVMGKGLALEFKNRFPDMFSDYQAKCAEKEVRVDNNYWITKDDRWVRRLGLVLMVVVLGMGNSKKFR
jgi:hypothetical protein